MGDFNGFLWKHEKKGGHLTGSSSKSMRANLDNLGLIPIEHQGGQFTWSNRRGPGKHIKVTLDRGVANDQWRCLFPRATLRVFPAIGSDHSPIMLNTMGDMSFLKQPFKFEAIWARDLRSHLVVKSAWANFD
ncbi:Endonuclease/exonuclease/phosphatase [Trema orientale]|uniref:Endonuclease/exonuclease/phosphatase n=1 Tax=Trema orientale TaxID=63057 RepID=A0A2P5CK01_TREOI|nr:Endonuclease/exonuclease/phosphatase [Trema orientale]